MGVPLKDVTGEKYHMLTITGLAPTRVTELTRDKRVYTVCECGGKGESSYKDLKKGKVKSCGCIKAPKLEVVPNAKYGHWTILRETTPYVSKNNKAARRLVVRCSCGKERVRYASSIINNKSNSCGCKGVLKEVRVPNPPPVISLP